MTLNTRQLDRALQQFPRPADTARQAVVGTADDPFMPARRATA